MVADLSSEEEEEGLQRMAWLPGRVVVVSSPLVSRLAGPDGPGVAGSSVGLQLVLVARHPHVPQVVVDGGQDYPAVLSCDH